jgi:pimeloyl-ACP methyl ester carboxylesterase
MRVKTGFVLNAKPLALLIPGLDGTGELFYRHLEALGLRYRPRPWSYEPGVHSDLDDLTLALAKATADEESGSILVIAESFGGLVALNFVLHYPERIRQLVLVNTFPYYRRKIRAWLASILTPLLLHDFAWHIKDFVVDNTLRLEGIPAADRRHYQDVIRHIDLTGYRQRLRLIRQVDLRPRLREIAIPTVLLAAGRDKLVPSIREASLMASRMRQARIHRFPDAGHALLLTPGFFLADYV